MFQEAVHNGHPDAKAMGPCFVDLQNWRTSDTGTWQNFLDAGGANYCDALSFHDYNTCVNGDINEGRNSIEYFFSKLEEAGVDTATTEMWQTEATHAKTSDLFAVAHFRRARFSGDQDDAVGAVRDADGEEPVVVRPVARLLVGIRRSWLPEEPTRRFCHPDLMRTLAEEIHGKLYHHRVDFGSVSANQIFLGNVYGSANTGSVVALVATSPLDLGTVTLQVVGTTNALVTVDAFGNESTVAQSSGRVTVDVGDVLTYRSVAGRRQRVGIRGKRLGTTRW